MKECERTEKGSSKVRSNILKMSTLALIAAMAGTLLQIVNDLQLHEGNTQSLPNLIFESRNWYKTNVYVGNISMRDTEYNVPESLDEREDPQWHHIWPQYHQDKARDAPGEKAKVTKPTLLSSMVFGLGIGPEFSSDTAGDGPKKSKSNEDEYDPEQERITKRA